jgi:hypothetical protein
MEMMRYGDKKAETVFLATERIYESLRLLKAAISP